MARVWRTVPVGERSGRCLLRRGRSAPLGCFPLLRFVDFGGIVGVRCGCGSDHRGDRINCQSLPALWLLEPHEKVFMRRITSRNSI
jgi:hypothetical protein